MRRGLPTDGSSAREARIRRAAPASQKSPAKRVSAPWWHQPLLWLLLLASVTAVNPQIRGEGRRHFAYLRTVVINHTLHFDRTDERSDATIGPSLLWSPFFLAAHAAVHVAQSRGSQIPADGLSWPYVWACAFGTAFYAFLALWMSYRLALRFAKSPAALLATFVIWLASSLPVYVYVLPFHTHTAAMFSAALVFSLWLSVRDGRDSRSRWFVWGLAGGLAIATSFLNGVLLVVALVECVTRLTRPRGFVQALPNGVIFLGGIALVALPALAIMRMGSTPIFHWTTPQLTATAFSTDHGAFVWTPILLLATLGFVVAIWRQPALGATLFLSGALFFYLVAAYDGRNGALSYGSPFLVTITPIFVCGLAALLDGLAGGRGRLAWAVLYSVSGLLILWNLGLMLQWGTGLIPSRGPVDFHQAALNQVTIVPRAARDFVIRYANDRKGLLSGIGRDRRE